MKIKNKKKSFQTKVTRKQQRKDDRKSKKARKNEYYMRRGKKLNPETLSETVQNEIKESDVLKKPEKVVKIQEPQKVESTESIRIKENKQIERMKKDMVKQRNSRLREANFEEDKNIKRLEKQLKLNKKRSKKIPKSFASDGLDYLLEVCDSETMESAVLAEKQLLGEGNDYFAEDFNLMSNKQTNDSESENEDIQSEEENDDNTDDDLSIDEEEEVDDEEEVEEEEEEEDSIENESDEDENSKEFENSDNEDLIPSKKMRLDGEDNEKSNDVWEDIYGRKRNMDGAVINQKYIPPGAREENENTNDLKRNEKLLRLKRQLKGLLNRLAESNMHSISNQIEELYMNNSRNDMNNTLTNLILEAIISPVNTPERLLIEHIVLIAVLHANVGTEVGAHFLQNIVKQINQSISRDELNIEDKTLDNLTNTIAQLYNFKLFDSKLIYDLVKKFSEKFNNEKYLECILHILRNVGFNLRKDDPIALKNLILDLQKHATSAPDDFKEDARVKFLLSVLLAIKNNNVSKIPNYDTSYPEHLKKVMKGFIRKGNFVTQLNISLDDLINVDERGKWWVIGSAWKGNNITKNVESEEKQETTFSNKLLELARKQRMNTETRRNIFCIIMSAEDYLDAFEKLLRLSLRNQQERDIIHVLMHCCLQEKKYNPYYSVLAQKFCEYDRKYQMTIKYAIWDKLKALSDYSPTHISNLAKLLSHLFIEKGLSISILKVLEFSQLDKLTLRFMRQTLLGVLLYEDFERCRQVFETVAKAEKLKMFRESLRLFIHHFLLRNLKASTETGVTDEQKTLIEERAKMVEQTLTKKERNNNYY